MLDAIRKFVDENILSGRKSTPSNEAAGRAPEGGPPSASDAPAASPLQIAAAALLLEIAHADGEFSAQEQARIEGSLAHHFGLDETTRGRLLELAELERKQSIDHFQFTKRILEEYDLGQRMVLAEIMWGVILTDGTVASHESYLVRKLGSLLELEPKYLASARRAAQG